MRLARTLYGEPTDRPRLVIVPGLFGSGRNWGVIARRLSDRRQVVTVDQRNHGDSPWADEHSYPAMAADLAELIEGLGAVSSAEGEALADAALTSDAQTGSIPGPAPDSSASPAGGTAVAGRAPGAPHAPVDLIGHSMGGKAAMILALQRPDLVRRLIVADIAPTAYRHTQMPLIEAMRAIGTDFPDRKSAEAALEPHVPDPTTRSFLLQSLDLKERRWRLNLNALGTWMPEILSFPEVNGRFEGPTLFLTGAESRYVRPEHRDRIKELFPRAKFARIPGAGHWLHAEKPREFEETARVFLEQPES